MYAVAGCGGTFDNGDTAASPNYPGSYNNHLDCTYTSTAAAGDVSHIGVPGNVKVSKIITLMSKNSGTVVRREYGKVPGS